MIIQPSNFDSVRKITLNPRNLEEGYFVEFNYKKRDGSSQQYECIVLDESNIQQAKTGAVVILKGAMYPAKGTNAVVHRSPTIEESGATRLLLRIDTNEFLNFI